MCIAHVCVIRCRGSAGAATVGPLQRFAGAVQDRTARDGLEACRRDRTSGPRSARHFAASRGEKPLLTRRRAVVQRRHCQQAAGNDARVFTALCLGKGASARAHGGDPCHQPCAGAQNDRPARCCASEGDHRRWSSRPAMKQRVHVHHGLGELQRVLSRVHAVRFKIGRTQRAGNDRNACSLADGAGQGAFIEEL